MLKMNDAPLATSILEHLATKQGLINSEATYKAKVNRGKSLWKSKSALQFKRIREKLETLCVGKRRCNYCEDSVADEVEHIKPKDLYPSLVFAWDNYLFACGNCNRPKSNLFAIFNGSNVMEISRKRGDPVVPPPSGADVFLNPRIEDPLDYMVLDFITMNFIPKPGISSTDKLRAKYTIDTLCLNSRDFLVAARKEAYNTYTDSLKVYVSEKGNNATVQSLAKRKLEIESRQHPTVWAEIKRQKDRDVEISNLFERAPELLT
ncbi:TPA: HNH endonuclease [Photobacterium damselae]